MKIKNFLVKIMVMLVIFTTFSYKTNEIKINNSKEQIVENFNKTIKKANNTQDELSEEDLEMFTSAFENVKINLSEYLDITGLNVENKESITLPNYNINYIAPTYTEAYSDIHSDMISSFDTESLESYEEFRMADYDVDKFATVAENNFINTSISPKYAHPTYVKPAYNPNSIQNRMTALLTSIGLAATAIYVLIGCSETLVATAPIAWCYPVSVPVTTTALLGIVTVILLNWGIICQVFDALIDLFIECISRLASLIEDFFAWVSEQVKSWSVAGSRTIGDKTFEFTEIKTMDVAGTIAIINKCRRSSDVYLMQYVGSESFQIALTMPVTEDFCVKNKTHNLGISSYTWYQNTARRLILNAGTGYTTTAPELHLYNDGDDDGRKSPHFAMKHFHNYDMYGVRVESSPQHWCHSFFGMLYYSPNNDGVGELHPDNPRP